jgi:hypothetical protein
LRPIGTGAADLLAIDRLGTGQIGMWAAGPERAGRCSCVTCVTFLKEGAGVGASGVGHDDYHPRFST